MQPRGDETAVDQRVEREQHGIGRGHMLLQKGEQPIAVARLFLVRHDGERRADHLVFRTLGHHLREEVIARPLVYRQQ